MMLGLSLSTFTTIHVIISLIAIATGFVTVFGMLTGNRMARWTAIFLVMTVLTSVTGFGFPFTQLLPSHVVGIISLAVLAVAIIGLYVFRLSGAWRWIYIACAVFPLYLNCFVGVVQAFMKIPALKALAPTQAEPPFLVAQLLLLVVFIVLGFLAVRRFTPAAA